MQGQINMKRLVLAVFMAALSGTALPSCLPSAPKADTPDLTLPTQKAVDMRSDGGFTLDSSLTARQTFTQVVQPLLLSTCGACHKIDGGVGPSFLKSASPDTYDPYLTVTNWHDFIIADPTQSLLLRKGRHTGPALCPPADQCVPGLSSEWDTVLAWLQLENTERARLVTQPFKPQVPPFYPALSVGNTKVNNIIDFGQISAAFNGISLQFYATVLPNNRDLEISNLRLFNAKANAKANEQRTIHMGNPRFLVWLYGVPHPDPLDSFSTTDKTVGLNQNDVDASGKDIPGAGNLIVPGLFTLTGYHPGSSLSVIFGVLELVGTVSSGNPCSTTGYNIFHDSIVPYIKATNAGKYTSCLQSKCHDTTTQAAGLNMGIVTTAGVDLSKLCESLKFYNGLKVISTNTDPTRSNLHPYKWSNANCVTAGLPGGCYNDFNALLTSWAAAEAM